MKTILFGASVLISFLGTSLVLILVAKYFDKTTISDNSIDVTAYVASKSVNGAANGFGIILTTLPYNVLSTSVTATATQVPPDFPESPQQFSKAQYTVAVLGDSMVDTLGKDLPHLQQELKRQLPQYVFTLHNFGAGASNIEYGLSRLTNGYSYLGESKPSLLSLNPDVVVIESFAYNHWNNAQSDLDRQWLVISRIIDTIKNYNPNTKIVLAATIAPYCPTYTDGSANLPPERKYIECETVKQYLQNMVNFATSQGYPLADAYHASLVGNEGNPKYINQGDHIHPSEAGKGLFAQKVTAAITGIF